MYRPRLFFDILPNKMKPNLLDVLLRNSGGSAAYDINCNFDPDLPYYDDTTLSKLAVFRNTPFLEHGQELRFMYRSLVSILEEGAAFGPKQSTVTITYSDFRKRPYKEQHIVNVERFKGVLIQDQRDLRDLYQELLNIRKELEHLQSRGILIKSPQDIKKEREDWLKRIKQTNEKSSEESSE